MSFLTHIVSLVQTSLADIMLPEQAFLSSIVFILGLLLLWFNGTWAVRMAYYPAVLTLPRRLSGPLLVILVSAAIFQAVRERRARRWVRTQRAIIDFSYAAGRAVPIPHSSLEYRLKLRAKENQRLVSAFGINNSLTTSDVVVHKRFLKRASAVVRPKGPGEWVRLYAVAEAELGRQVYEGTTVLIPHKGSVIDATATTVVKLADCVRCLCLTVVLVDTFNVEDPERDLPRDVVLTITREINSQWLRSKGDPLTPRSERLSSALASLNLASGGPAESSSSEGDAQDDHVGGILGLIMPQYETLWRVVLLTFVTVYHHSGPDRLQAITHMVEQVPECLGLKGMEEKALRVAMEGLRLFPSNKGIHRATKTSVFANDVTANNLQSCTQSGQPLRADIEACHRDPAIWGDEALAFRPERFGNNTEMALRGQTSGHYILDDVFTDSRQQAYFPYSLSPHKCPAANGFGNRMITMLVVALGRRFPPLPTRLEDGKGKGTGRREEGWVIRYQDAVLDGDVNRPLPTGRDQMDKWTVELVKR